jgi:hypothetical protein
MTEKRSLLLYLIPLSLILAVFTISAISNPLSDFAGYYFGGIELLRKNYLGAYDMQELNLSIAQLCFKDVYVSYAPFPPFTSIITAFFTLFPVAVAKVLFNAFSCSFFLFSLCRAVHFFSIPKYILLLIPVIFFHPIMGNILNGQAYLLLTCLLFEGYIAYKQNRVMASSLFWGIAIMFKIFPIVIVLFLLLRKGYRNIIYLGFACLFLLLISVWVNGSDAWIFYITKIIPKLGNGELNDSFTSAFQSTFMLCKKALVYDQLLNPNPIHESKVLFTIIIGIFKAILISIGISFTLQKKDNDFMPFTIWIVISMLISPNGSNYSLILLLLPILALVSDASNTVKYSTIVMIVLCLLCNINVGKFGVYPLFSQFPRLYLFHIFFLLLIAKRKIPFHMKVFIPLVAVFIIVPLYKIDPNKDNSSYLLAKENHLFIYDFDIKGNRLVYYSWEGTKKSTLTNISIKSVSSEETSLRNNQIYYKGKQITNSPDWKKKATLINNNAIVYLSDKNRGVCFYTLRKISLSDLR